MVNNDEWVTNSSVVFANATCFEPEMLDTLAMLLRIRFVKGQVLILTTKELEVDEA